MYVSTTQFSLPPNLAPLSAPLKAFQESCDCGARLVVGAFIFHHGRGSQLDITEKSTTQDLEPRLLVLHRAETDSYGGLWDLPGGGCEATDETILESIRREVWEETGLRVSGVLEFLGTFTWEDRRKPLENDKWVKFSFIAQVVEDEGSASETNGVGQAPPVRLAEDEHQDFRWIREDDIAASLAESQGCLQFIAREELELATEAFKRVKKSSRQLLDSGDL